MQLFVKDEEQHAELELAVRLWVCIFGQRCIVMPDAVCRQPNAVLANLPHMVLRQYRVLV